MYPNEYFGSKFQNGILSFVFTESSYILETLDLENESIQLILRIVIMAIFLRGIILADAMIQ